MKFDLYGQPYTNVDELFNLLYKNPEINLGNFLVEDPEQYNKTVTAFHCDLPKLRKYIKTEVDSVDLFEFDKANQSKWFMPDEYKLLDIEQYILNLCDTESKKNRVQLELDMYKDRNLLDLLKFLHYLIDILRDNNVIWGVGRGSSVASYVLYLLGVHRIDSLKYNLDIGEFLKDE